MKKKKFIKKIEKKGLIINNFDNEKKENSYNDEEILEAQLEEKSEENFIFNGKLFKINKKNSSYIYLFIK